MKRLLSSVLSQPLTYPFQRFLHTVFYIQKKSCISLFKKEEKKISKQFTSWQQWVQEKKQTIRRVLKLDQKCSIWFLCYCVYFILPDQRVVLSSCAIFGHSFALVWLLSWSLFISPSNSPQKALSGLMAKVVSHESGSRIIVHRSTTVRQWKTSRPLVWQEVSFSCSCVSQKGRLLSRQYHYFEADVSWTIAWSPHTGALQPSEHLLLANI